MLRILIFLLFAHRFNCLQSIHLELIEYGDPRECNRSEYFNVELMKCQFCDANQFLVPASNKHECVCNEKSQPIYDASKSTPKHCEKCKPNMLFSTKINACIRCSNGVYKKDNVTMCKPCKENEIMVHHFTNGTFLNQIRCIPCANGMVPSKDGTNCTPCPILNPIKSNGTIKCMCDFKSVLLGNVCVLKQLFPEVTNIKNKYFLQYDREKINSELFETQLKTNLFLCKLKNSTACQILANLCSLTLFNNYNNSPCNLWMESRYSINPETPIKLPWLIYREGDANIVLNRRKIGAKYSLNPKLKTSHLNLTAVIINLNGTIKEVKPLLGSDLNLCPDLNYIKNEGLRFGINYNYECQVDSEQLFSGMNTEFIVPYLQYWENGRSKLYAVPVLIRNLPQYNNNPEDTSSWLLVRRFFLFDSISSIAKASDSPTILRYIKSIEVRVKLRYNEENGLIFPPLIIINYGVIPQEKFCSDEKIQFRFSVNYEMENNLKHSIEISIGVLSALAILYSGIQCWSYSKRSGLISIDLSTVFHLLIFACGNLANVFFTVAFGVSLYTFIFYKGQNVVHLLLPTKDQEDIIKAYIIAAFSLKFQVVELGILIWQQISMDIFLIDWERPQPQDTIPRPKKSASTFTLTSSNKEFVSIWRSYFIANEWNHIQTKRKINLLVHMLVVLFLLKVLGLEYWGTTDPVLHTNIPEHLKKIPMNFVCRFAVGTLVYVVVYLVQLVFMVGIYERYIKNVIQQFVDVCSLANISVFIMSYARYGHYIHGRSSHGFADTDMATMIKQLQREADDLCAYRGLLPGTHHQTFSVGVPAKLRLYYNKLMLTTKNTLTNARNINLIGMSPNKNVRLDKLEKIIQAYHNLNKFLSAFLEHAFKELDYDVKEKCFIEDLLDIEITEWSDQGVLFTDNGHSFDSVLFYGNEFCLFSFDIMLFSLIIILSDNFILSVFVTLTIAEILKAIRNFGGKRNLALKTLIDARFLI